VDVLGYFYSIRRDGYFYSKIKRVAFKLQKLKEYATFYFIFLSFDQ
jgi:hypothetical protein